MHFFRLGMKLFTCLLFILGWNQPRKRWKGCKGWNSPRVWCKRSLSASDFRIRFTCCLVSAHKERDWLYCVCSTAVTAVHHRCSLTWIGLHCNQDTTYAMSSCFIKYTEDNEFTSVRAYSPTRASYDFRIRQLSSSVDADKYWFYVRTIPVWNASPPGVTKSASHSEFIRSVSTTLSSFWKSLFV